MRTSIISCLTLFAICLLPSFIYAQNTFPATGNVGIGTASPVVRLSIYGAADEEGAISLQSAGNSRFYIQQGGALLKIGGLTPGGMGAINVLNTGNIGIATGTPSEKLTINGNILVGQGNQFGIGLTDKFTYDGKSQPHYGMQWIMDSWSTSGPTFWAAAYGGMKFLTQGVSRVAITGAGNVGIGTITPQAKLAVNGDIFAKRIKVTQTGWPDYVFAEDYKLPSLAEVAAYVKEHKHLQGMPAEKEVVENGLDVGEMNRKLLQKVEELTLYLLQVDKQNQELKIEVEKLKTKIK